MRIEATSDGQVRYSLDDVVKYTVTDTSLQSGKIQFIPGCVGMTVRNVVVAAGGCDMSLIRGHACEGQTLEDVPTSFHKSLSLLLPIVFQSFDKRLIRRGRLILMALTTARLLARPTLGATASQCTRRAGAGAGAVGWRMMVARVTRTEAFPNIPL